MNNFKRLLFWAAFFVLWFFVGRAKESARYQCTAFCGKIILIMTSKLESFRLKFDPADMPRPGFAVNNSVKSLPPKAILVGVIS